MYSQISVHLPHEWVRPVTVGLSAPVGFVFVDTVSSFTMEATVDDPAGKWLCSFSRHSPLTTTQVGFVLEFAAVSTEVFVVPSFSSGGFVLERHLRPEIGFV
jgi:hypothetical protein